ncbi:LysR family transcriptional regulator [Streptomyces atratus]|uniref:LysR family transcriptional regulator n=1 Tax=Streptomyces atratus TaxID=1893 RepID=UPI002256B318|nr:LysR family transcriptional regulator [Streptomyces atratus]MCX5342505.1 LysR family transcriptional regulator [Streptomyces atratus]
MDTHRLLIFREVARAESIAAAARALGWTQPAVSQHLRLLERQAGTPLVVRHSRGIRLTEAGTTLLRHADAIATRLRAAEDDMAALANLSAGTVRLAAFPSASATLVPAAMTELAEHHPGLEVRLLEQEPPQAVDLVTAGEADLALIFSHDDRPPEHSRDLLLTRLAEDQVRLVVPACHPAEAAGPAALPLLADDPWIAGCPTCAAHLIRTCEAAGFTPDVRHNTDDYVVVQTLVARRLGVALLPQLALDAYHHPGVRSLPLPDSSGRSLYLVRHREALRIPAVETAAEAIRRAVAASGRPAV